MKLYRSVLSKEQKVGWWGIVFVGVFGGGGGGWGGGWG